MIASTDFSGSAKAAAPRSTSLRSASPLAAREQAARDHALVNRFNAGDESALGEIIAHYRDRMFSIALSMLHNRADAEEIAQDTFIRAHRGLARFRGDSSLATWLHRITLNLSRNRYWFNIRRCKHQSLPFDTAFSDDNQTTLAGLIASDRPNPAQEATTAEFTELVGVCMDRLGAGHRDILTRRNIQHWSYDEIARHFGISTGTVKSRIARARENLRKLIASACPEFTDGAAPREWFDPVRASGHLEAISA